MAPFDQLVDKERKADAVKEDTCLSHIKLLQEQFAEAACQQGIDLLTHPAHSDTGTDVDEIGNNEIYGKEYNDHDEDFSYHSSDGLAKENADSQGELGHNMGRMSPMATLGGKEGSTCNSAQVDNSPNWLHEINKNQIFGKADLLIALINQIFPCVVCNNHKNINNPSTWIPIFLWKLGVTTVFLWKSGVTMWELFDVDFAAICAELVWDGDEGLGNMWGIYYKCPDAESIQRIWMSQMDATARCKGFAGSLGDAISSLFGEATIPQAPNDATATAMTFSSSISSLTPGTLTSGGTQA
jgi:hypothetical protein